MPVYFIVVFLLVTLIYVFLFLIYLVGWLTLREYQRTGLKPITKVSIIIPARNEESNIANLLNDLLQQNYPQELFEIIVVDDFSEDRTAEIVSSFQNKNLR